MTKKTCPWYRRKRLLIPLSLLLVLLVALAGAVIRSDVSRIIVFNETGGALAAIHLTACGQSITFSKVPTEASVRWKLQPHGSPSEINLEVAKEPPLQWHGAYIESQGGYVITLRIWPDGQVEEHRQITFWQRLLKGAPNLSQ
jgi:hypothetical protein